MSKRIKKKQSKFIIIAMTASVITILAGSIFSYKYYQQSKKEMIVEEFISQFEKKEFEKMVKTFDQVSLKEAKLDSRTTIEKYNTIFNGLDITKIEGKLESISDTIFKAKFSMVTPLGKLKEISYSGKLNKKGSSYLINWDYSLIFPEMEIGDKVFMNHVTPVRGDILDRNGEPLATFHDYPQYGTVPNQLGEGTEKEARLEKISKQLDISREKIEDLLNQSWIKEDSFIPLKTMDYNSNFSQITEDSLQVRSISKRYYPLKEAAAHLIGYTGSITAEEIEKDPTLSGFEIIGKTGLEAQFDKTLRGEIGGKIEIVDENNQVKSIVIEQKIKEGSNVQLTIDSYTQQSAYTALDNLSGTTVVTEPKTGRIIVAVSSPSYDPNEFILGMKQKQYEELANNPLNPFLARFGVGYAPGSTFKAITAAIGIDVGVTSVDKSHDISGLKWQKDSSWGDYFVTRVSDVPTVNMEDALVYSDNIYFSMETLEMGKQKYLNELKKFPFGEKMNVHIPMTPAQISNDDIKSDILLADTSYGQGQLLINPIQQAIMYSVFPNGGSVVMPKIIKDDEITELKGIISSEAASLVTKALTQTVKNPNGTAHILQSGKEIAAKTGTAEIKEKQNTKGKENSFILAFDSNDGNYLVISMIEGAEGTSAVEKNRDFIIQLQ